MLVPALHVALNLGRWRRGGMWRRLRRRNGGRRCLKKWIGSVSGKKDVRTRNGWAGGGAGTGLTARVFWIFITFASFSRLKQF